MAQRPYRDVLIAAPIGVAGALAFAVLIGFIPEAAFGDTGWRVLLYALQVPAGPIIVLALYAVARLFGADRHRFVMGVVAGALTFDGLAVGFFPGVYGQPDDLAVWVGSTLLWAFAWIVAAELVLEARRGSPADRHGSDRLSSARSSTMGRTSESTAASAACR